MAEGGRPFRTAILSSVITVVLLLGGLITLQYYTAPKGQRKFITRRGDFVDLHVRLPLPFLFSGREPEPTKLVYLNREGARLRGGGDDATHNRASLVGDDSGTLDYPGYAGSHYTWRRVMRCLRTAFRDFDIEITDQRPVDRNYVMVLMGGSPRVLKRKGSAHLRATGLSPYNGLPIANGVCLVFTKKIGPSWRRICETAAHEIGHVYGLDHAYHCRDFMTYLPYCGTKRFVNKAVSCGEKKKRKCKGGKGTQNSHAHLADLLGRRRSK